MKTNFLKARVGLASAFVGVAVLLGCTGSASGQSVLEVISGGVTNVGTLSGLLNSWSGSIGGWNINFDGGISSEGFDLTALNVTSSGTTAPITILFSAAGFGPGSYESDASVNLTGGLTAVFSTFYGATTLSMANVLAPSITDVNSGPFIQPFSSSTFGSIPNPGSYAVTEQIVVSGATAPGSFSSADYSLTPVPEPSSIALMVMGGGTLIWRRFKGVKSRS